MRERNCVRGYSEKTNEISREGWTRRRCSEDREIVKKMRRDRVRERGGENATGEKYKYDGREKMRREKRKKRN